MYFEQTRRHDKVRLIPCHAFSCNHALNDSVGKAICSMAKRPLMVQPPGVETLSMALPRGATSDGVNFSLCKSSSALYTFDFSLV